ncbi:MAG: UPF0182 family protein [Cyanobacteria bacterium P01_E01_bin.42]
MNEPIKLLGKIALCLLSVWLLFDIIARFVVEILWFDELDYLAAFFVRFRTQASLCAIASSISSIFLLANLRIAHFLKYPSPSLSSRDRPQNPRRETSLQPYLSLKDSILQGRQNAIVKSATPAIAKPAALSLNWLFLAVPILASVPGLSLIHYGRIALDYWQPNLSLAKVTPPLPPPFDLVNVSHILGENIGRGWGIHWQWAVLAGSAIGFLFAGEFIATAIAIVLSLLFGLTLSGNWTRILEFFAATPFNHLDPLYHLDISFYLFRLPLWELLYFWLGGLFLYGWAVCTLIYLLSGDSLSKGRFEGFSRGQLRHIDILGGLVMLALVFYHLLAAVKTIYSTRGVTYGASYTDLHVQLPVEVISGTIAGAVALWLLYRGFYRLGRDRQNPKIHHPLTLVLLAVYMSVFLSGEVMENFVQRLNVQPNELERETPYLKRNISETRAAFALDRIEAETFDPQDTLNPQRLANNRLTIENIRLWDARPLLEANRQLQEIRLYYRFHDADIDRYTMQIRDLETEEKRSTQKQQVLISARELDYNRVPEEAQTWVNQHLVYTHGYGFTLSPVNKVDRGGLPAYFVQDIATEEEGGTLRLADEIIEGSIPIGKPRIYFGELSDTYIMTNTKVQELDFPSGQDNAQNIYDGIAGVSLNSPWRRFIFAEYLKDWQMLFTQNFTDETRVLFRRNINRRIRQIAPFLRYDSDPYLVNADTGDKEAKRVGNYLYWIIDAYTTSDRYPYSDPGEREFNYIRNPVKVVIDAYNGTVDFYIADPDDPIIQTWAKILPGFFKPLAEMPDRLREHIRYPTDFFSIQSERLLTYHMTDPKVFYNREDQWQNPQEIYGDELLPVAPYHLIVRLPGEKTEEFILLHPYSPRSRPNLIAWLAARSDGDRYGKLLLYQFPKQKLVFGISQIEALINQDPDISQQISLWNTQGSRIIQGNLLIIPIEDSLLYIEPLYLEAEQNKVPTLARVIVIYENKIVMANTLDAAFIELFQPRSQNTADETIIRSVDEVDERLLEGVTPNN